LNNINVQPENYTILRLSYITTYQQTKSAYGAYRRARNKEQFNRPHESSLILYETAAKALKVHGGDGNLPNVAAL
jgi:hypothetical protein